MRSLLVRIFLSFWLIIGIAISIAALSGYHFAERTRDTAENFADSDLLLAASDALSASGQDGLRQWLLDNRQSDGIHLFVFDASGQDLLGRRPNRLARELLVRQHRLDNGRSRGNLRPARRLPQLVAPDGDVLTFVATPLRNPYRRWLADRAVPLFLIIALLSSAAVSYLLARTLSRPVKRLRDATVAIAEGNLDTRVADSLNSRNDELGLLAKDFDRMASRLEQAARQQSELSSNISHELRSPLARLRVALELARRQTGELQEFERIELEAERLDQLIGQILSYSRLDAARTEQRQLQPVAEILKDVIDNVAYENRGSQDRPVELVLDADELPKAPVFLDALRSALENVLRNAVAHSPPGSTVSISARQTGGNLQIEIEDHGEGVDEAELGKLFEPFFRTRASQLENARSGNGLGLAIAARAVALHGGSISARNRADGGLRVVLSLPLTVAG